jgi:hypothetical protein
LSKAAEEENRAAAQSQALEQMLNEIVNRMEDDPMADYGVWLEHKAMKDSLNAMNQGAMKSAQASLQTGNKEAAKNALQQASSELERMTALSEDLTRSQNAKDLVDRGEKAEDMANDLVNKLEKSMENGGKPDNALANQINQMVAEAQKALQDMARTLQNQQKDLPEDFVNQQALKNVDVAKPQDTLSKIAEAMRKGDYQEALRLAKDFLKMAKQISKQMNDAHEGFSKANSPSGLAKEMDEKAKKLEEIADEQRKILAETHKLESKRMEALMKKQKEMLRKLAERQRKVVERDQHLGYELHEPATYVSRLRALLVPLQVVLGELSAQKVEQSPGLLPSIVLQFGGMERELAAIPPIAEITDGVTWIRSEEEAILKELQKEPDTSDAFSGEDQQQFDSLGQQQSALASKTDSLKKEMQKLSQKTALVGMQMSMSLSGAGDDMKGSSGELKGRRSRGAQEKEESALRHLQDGMDALQQAQQSMMKMAGQEGEEGSGSGGGMPKVIARRSGGRSGTDNQKVRLPRAEDYKPPKAFREELLESLKEKYPKIYEEIIHKYYKHLAD